MFLPGGKSLVLHMVSDTLVVEVSFVEVCIRVASDARLVSLTNGVS